MPSGGILPLLLGGISLDYRARHRDIVVGGVGEAEVSLEV